VATMSMAHAGSLVETAPPTGPLTGLEREQMIVKFAPMVRYVVGRLVIVLPQVFDMDDLIGYGTIGLIEAVDRFDPARGVGFESFATERIRGSVIDALRAADWIPRTSRKRAKDIQRVFGELEEELGRPPADEDVAARLGISLTQMRRAMSDAICTVTSLQRAVRSADDEDGATLMDYVADNAPTPVQGLEDQELLGSIRGALGRLDEREKRVLSLYYEHDLTLREIAEVLEISESRVWQLHARAITRIRAYIDGDDNGSRKGAA